MNESLSFGGHRVIGFGFALGDVGDLLAYRNEWEPFIAAHLALWRDLNSRFENAPELAWCPKGNFTRDQIKNLDPVPASWCASLLLTRQMVSPTDPGGILARWNAWKDSSSAQMIAGANQMLESHQNTVLSVGGPDKDRLLGIAKQWGIEITLPPLPDFSTQQEIIARIQGAYISTKGILQIIGYGPVESLVTAADVAQATADGLKDTAHQLPQIAKWVGIAAAVTVVVVGGVLIAYYVPRRETPASLQPAPI